MFRTTGEKWSEFPVLLKAIPDVESIKNNSNGKPMGTLQRSPV